MRKFSKILESKEEFLTKLGTSEDEIKDICSDLIDEDFTLKISNEYLGTNGHTYDEPNETPEYYPIISIDLERSTENDDSARTSKDKFNDVRKWSGSVYYEGDINILKMLYEIVYRFESMFTSDKAEVYYSIRGINDINIRITFGLEKGKAALDLRDIAQFISNHLEISDRHYEISDCFGDNTKKSIRFDARDNTFGSDKLYKELVTKIAKSGRINDKDYMLTDLLDPYVKMVFDECKKRNPNLKLIIHGSGESAKITISGNTLISFDADFEKTDTVQVVMAKGIFKDRTEKIDIYAMDLAIVFHYEPKLKRAAR